MSSNESMGGVHFTYDELMTTRLLMDQSSSDSLVDPIDPIGSIESVGDHFSNVSSIDEQNMFEIFQRIEQYFNSDTKPNDLYDLIMGIHRKYKQFMMPKTIIDMFSRIEKWSWRCRKTTGWWKIYNEIHRYAETHKKLPTNKSKYWIIKQKREYRAGNLTQYQIDALNDIYAWEWLPNSDIRWLTKYNEFKNGIHDKTWIYIQRSKYNNAKLSSERINALNELPEWKWDVKTRPGAWWAIYDKLKKYIDEHGDMKAYPGKTWLTRQRCAYKNEKLSTDQINALEQIPGWCWDRMNVQWWNRYHSIMFKIDHERSLSRGDRRWVRTNRTPEKMDKMSPKQIDAFGNMQDFLLF